MKKLDLPPYLDSIIINQLANNSTLRGTSYPYLLNNLTLIHSQYTHYINNNGNALNIVSRPISNDLKTGLIKNYNSPPKELKHLTDLRNSSPDICPMCGSNHAGTLDHLMPKENFPEWAVFSWNLVPACECNTKRGQTLIGNRTNNERILHPYFDTVLGNRNISCTIIPEDDYRIVLITIDCIATGTDFNAIQFHIEEVVKKAGIINWLEKQWIKIYQEPTTVIQTLDEDRIINDTTELTQLLEKFLKRLDKRHGTPNNWESVLIHGILKDDNAKQFILERHNDIVNDIVNPEDM